MKVINGHIYREGSFVENKQLCTEGEYFAETSGDDEVLDAEGCYVIPGLIDIHFHGCAGVDFCDGTMESLETLAAYELAHGITTIHPATMTIGEAQLLEIGKNAAEFYRMQHTDGNIRMKYAELAGIYMEGPFVSMEKKGAQNPKYVKKPDIAMFRRLQDAAEGLYRICVVAPETEDAMEFIDELRDEVRISIAHTAADYDTAAEAIRHGARQVTHLYNAMQPFAHRAPGVIGAACDSEEVMPELICDGVHIHPSVIRTTFKMFGAERMILISDSLSATGMTDGIYQLGGQEVQVCGNRATLTVNGAIAGSATNLYDCMCYAVKTAGISLAAAVQAVTENPARAIGIDGTHGSIGTGKYADCLLVDQELKIRHIIKKGTLVS